LKRKGIRRINGKSVSAHQELKHFLLLSIISPAVGLIQLFKGRSESFLVAGSTIMMGLFGAFFAYPEGSDGHSHYLRSLEYYSTMNLSEFWSISWNILLQEPGQYSTELYIHFLSFLSNSVFGIPKSLHFFAGLVLGYFVIKSLLLVLGKELTRINWKSGLWVFIILLLVHAFFALNAIRISTASWVLFYSIAGFYFTRKFKFLLLIPFAVQIHLAYVIIGIPAILTLFLANRKWLVLGVFAFSFFFELTFFDVDPYLPETEVVDRKTNAYVYDDERFEELEHSKESVISNSNWYAQLGPKLYFDYAVIIALAGIAFFYFKSKDSQLNFLVSGALLFYTLSNMFPFIPSLQGRLFNNVSLYLLFAMLYIFNQSCDVRLKGFSLWFSKNAVLVFSILSIPFMLKNISHILNTTEVFFLFMPVLSFFSGEDFSIREFIGLIL
jgi:hypothetical protein